MVTERNYDCSPRSISSDQISSCPLLAVSGQPDPIGAQQSNPSQRSKQLLVCSYLHQVAQRFQHLVVAGIDHPPAPYLQGEVEGGEAQVPQIPCKPLIPGCLPLQG